MRPVETLVQGGVVSGLSKTLKRLNISWTGQESLVNELTSPPSSSQSEPWFGHSFSNFRAGGRKLIAWPLEKPPQQSQTVKLVDRGACGDSTLRNADNTHPPGKATHWRQENEPQCSFLFGRTRGSESARPSCAPLRRRRSRKSQRRRTMSSGSTPSFPLRRLRC